MHPTHLPATASLQAWHDLNVLRVTLSSLPVLIRVLRCGYEVNRLFHMKLFHHHHDHKGMWTE